MPIAIPRANLGSKPAAEAGPSAVGGRGLKGLFSRTRVMSPEPVEPPPRSRFRTLVDDVSAKVPGAKATQKDRFARLTAGRSVSEKPIQAEDRNRTPRPTAQRQPRSPEVTTRRGRVGITLPPAMQKGNDGKWQPPSLSKGSMSTSALAQLHDDEDDEHGARPADPKQGKPALQGLFNSGRLDENMATRMDGTRVAASKLPSVETPAASPHRSRPVGGKSAPAPPVVYKQPHRNNSPETTIRAPSTPTRTRQAVSPAFSGRPGSRHTSRVQLTTANSDDPPKSKATSTARRHAKSDPPVPGATIRKVVHTLNAHVHPPSTPSEHLSSEHYHIRLATSFLLKTLTPVVKGSAFASSEKNVEMKKLADERLAGLGRIEKNWGADWIRAAAAGFEQKDGDNPLGKDGIVRVANIGERAKERERRGFSDALRDGVLLCLYLNLLLPAQPSHITRISLTDDGVLKTTNITRFIHACEVVTLPAEKTFAPSDMSEGSERSIGQVALTVVSLARLAGRGAASRSRSPPGTRSAASSRPPSRGMSLSPPSSPPQRNRALATPSPPITPQRPTHAVRSVSPTRLSPPQSRLMERTRSAENTNELQAKLQAVADMPPPAAPILAPPRTPPTSGMPITSPTPTPSPNVTLLPRQPGLNRSQTQPNVSPTLRPRSAASNSTSGSTTPTRSRRPSLRPRNTTGNASGTGTRVSFADKEPVSAITDSSGRSSISSLGPNPNSHVKERTPSLVSGTSRTTSAYTRSSAAYSALTVLGDVEDDATVAVDLDVDVSPNGTAIIRDRSRRNSEKTLHNARQKFIGSLLSSPDDTLVASPLPNDQDPGRAEALRAEAFSRSLAALEGGAAMRGSPNRSQPMKRGSSGETGRQDVGRVQEEEEEHMMDTDRPPNGRADRADVKFYLSSRSISPTPFGTSPDPSPTLPGFSHVSPPASRPMSRNTSRTSVDQARPSSRVDRRLSDRNGVYRAKFALSATDVADPQNELGRANSRARLNSVATTSSSRRPSFDRGGRSRPVSLVMLEFEGSNGETVRYQLGNSIGRGQFGVVYKALNMSTGQMVAVKRISLEGMDDKQAHEVMREVELLKSLSHPSIVKYEGMKRDSDTLDIILEYVENGSLGSLIKDFGSLSETLVASYTAKILEGLDYLHAQGVIHRDLKAANILSTKNGNIKLSDFGVSLNTKAVENIKQEVLTASKNGGKADLSDVVGTPNWMAPEIIDMTGASFASDIWSLGCTIVELLTGQPPYADISNSLSVMYRIVEDEDPPIPPGLPENLDHFLRLCFKKEPRLRPSAVQLFEHPWLLKHCPELSLLRGQDSVPFLRRVSADVPRVDTGHLFPESRPAPRSRPVSFAASVSSKPETDSARKRLSYSGSTKSSKHDDQKLHQLVKTTFAKAIICRVCHTRAKAGVLCQDCGLVCHASCVTKETNKCDPLEQLALYTRQRELSTAATVGDSTTSLGYFPLESDNNLTALPGNIWKRSRAVLERRGSNLLASASKHDLNFSTLDQIGPAKGGRSVSGPPTTGSASRGKENEDVEHSSAPSAGDGEHVDTIRQTACKTVSTASSGAHRCALPEEARGHTRAKDSKSDCVIM